MTDRETQMKIQEITNRLDTLSFQQENTSKEIQRTKERVINLISSIQVSDYPKETPNTKLIEGS